MSNFNITGTLHVKQDAEKKSDSFTVREFVLKTQDGNFEQFLKFQLTQDRCDLLEGFKEGQEMTVHFDLRGREWQGKYFTSLNAWKLESSATIQPEAATQVTAQENAPSGNAEEQPQAPDDSLPF